MTHFIPHIFMVSFGCTRFTGYGYFAMEKRRV